MAAGLAADFFAAVDFVAVDLVAVDLAAVFFGAAFFVVEALVVVDLVAVVFFAVGDSTHGQHNRLRAPGSIGQSSDPSRVFKGMKMAGRYGNDRIKVRNLQVAKIMSEENILLITGSVPGTNGGFVEITNLKTEESAA